MSPETNLDLPDNPDCAFCAYLKGKRPLHHPLLHRTHRDFRDPRTTGSSARAGAIPTPRAFIASHDRRGSGGGGGRNAQCGEAD